MALYCTKQKDKWTSCEKEPTADSAVESLRVFTNCLSGIDEKGVISITGVWDVGGVKGTQAMKQAYAMGKNS